MRQWKVTAVPGVAPLNRALDLDARHRSGHLNSARLDGRGERTLRDEAQEDWTRSRRTQHEHAGGCPRVLRALVAILDLQRNGGRGRRFPYDGKAVPDENLSRDIDLREFRRDDLRPDAKVMNDPARLKCQRHDKLCRGQRHDADLRMRGNVAVE